LPLPDRSWLQKIAMPGKCRRATLANFPNLDYLLLVGADSVRNAAAFGNARVWRLLCRDREADGNRFERGAELRGLSADTRPHREVLAMPDENAVSEKKKDDRKRILLVDDDREIVESMKIALEAAGYQILIARDGNQGLAMAEREDPDLMILDMMMPKRSGFLVLEKLRRSRPIPLRVIMITANEGSRHKAYAEMLGVDDYVRKPFAMDRLLDSVGRLLA